MPSILDHPSRVRGVAYGRSATAAGLAAGFVADVAFGDPRRGHPVALFGSAAARLERRIWADSRARGAVYTVLCAGAVTALGAVVPRRPVTRFAATAVATWVVLGGRGLAEEGTVMADLLDDGDLSAARQRLSHL